MNIRKGSCSVEHNETIKITKEYELKPGDKIVSRVVTENQSNSYKHHEETVEEYKEQNDDAFFHLIFKYGTIIFRELEEKAPGNKCNIHIIRFIVLASYITYKGKLIDKYGHGIKKSSLKKIWDTTSRNSINETYDILLECGYIYETEGGCLMINKDMVIKGEIKEYYKELKKQDGRYTYTRIYMDNLRDMVKSTEPKQRKQLANLFKALPYINFKYNVFCENPTETDKTKIKPLTWTDLARICGYDDKKQVARFKKDLMSLKVYGQDVIGEFSHGFNKRSIVVNPAIYYGGINADDVKGISALFAI
jgi:hypothetical protein